MKPIKLTIEGVNSFTDRQELDFDAVGRNNLFCICGKTGAGKTTVFDCLMLALYGRSGKGNLADVVNLSRMSARVALEFESAGDMYLVDRAIKCRAEKGADGAETDKRTATSECTLYINGEPLLKGEQASEKIAEIIGLAESEFKNVYLLEQGEYAEFLKKQPAKQTEAVGKIFSLMRFGDVYKRANEKQRDARAQAEATEIRMHDLGNASPELLRAAKTELSALRAKNTVLAKEIESKKAELEISERERDAYISAAEKVKAVKNQSVMLGDAQKRFAAATEKYDAFVRENTDDDAKRLIELRERLNTLSALNALDKEYAAAVADAALKTEIFGKQSNDADEAIKYQSELQARAERDFSAFDDATKEFADGANTLAVKSQAVNKAVFALSTGEREMRIAAIAEVIFSLRAEKTAYDGLCERKKQADERAAAGMRACDELLAKIEKYMRELESAEREKAAAEEALALADAALARAQLSSHAAAVRAELNAGDACPVCGGVFGGGGTECAGDVARCKDDKKKAESALKAAVNRVAELARSADMAKGDFDRQSAESDARAKESSEYAESIAALCVEPTAYGLMSRALAKAKKAGEDYAAVAADCIKCASAVSEHRAKIEAAARAAREATEKAEGLKKRLGDACGNTDDAIDKIKAETAELERKIAQIEKLKGSLAAELEAARSVVCTLESSLAAAQKDCPVDMPQFDEDGYRQKRAICDDMQKNHTEREKDIATKDAEIKTLAEKCDRLRELSAERNEHAKRADRYGVIAEITKSKAMLNYVAAEYIADFTAIASEILIELSGGKYTICYDRDNGFVVSDYLNGGKSRKTDTLSGGELFLASLSVAIAIARAQSKGNNAFFFLDEGFGTLDDDLIDTVYAALETLSKDCLVGVISHSGALIDRMPSCVEIIEATDTSGSKIRY